MTRHDGSDVLHARTKVPISNGVPRFVQIGSQKYVIRLKELIVKNIDTLFPGTEIIAYRVCRITCTVITDNEHSETEDLLEVIVSGLQNRKFAQIVRLQTAADVCPTLKRTLATKLGIKEKNDVFERVARVCLSHPTDFDAIMAEEYQSDWGSSVSRMIHIRQIGSKNQGNTLGGQFNSRIGQAAGNSRS